MNLAMLLDKLNSVGVTLTLADDDATFFASPKSALTAELRALLREYKPAIVAYLQSTQWDAEQARVLVKDLTATIRAWRAVADAAGIAASAVTVAMATEAIQHRDMPMLREALACHEDAYNWWCDQALPVVATDTPAQRWACSVWPGDAPELLDGQSHYVFDDGEAA